MLILLQTSRPAGEYFIPKRHTNRSAHNDLLCCLAPPWLSCMSINLSVVPGVALATAELKTSKWRTTTNFYEVSRGANTIKKNTDSTQNKSQTHRAKLYEVRSFLSTDCELSTMTCSKNVYSLGPRSVSYFTHHMSDEYKSIKRVRVCRNLYFYITYVFVIYYT